MHPLQTTIDQYAAQFDRRRMTILAAHVEEDNGTVLRGRVLDRSQHAALLALLPNVRDELIVLREQPEHGFATVTFGVLDVRWQATRDSELVTEASFGEGLEVLAHEHECNYQRWLFGLGTAQWCCAARAAKHLSKCCNPRCDQPLVAIVGFRGRPNWLVAMGHSA